VPLDGKVLVDDDCRRDSESRFFTRVVRESRLGRGRGDDATYLLPEFTGDGGIFTMVVLPYVPVGDDATLVIGLFDIGIEELRNFPSNDMFLRLLCIDSGRVRLVSFFVIDRGPLLVLVVVLKRLLVLFVRLLFEGGPADVTLPLGGLVKMLLLLDPLDPGSGILLGFDLFGVSGHLSRSC
jgi:hypothetical protein